MATQHPHTSDFLGVERRTTLISDVTGTEKSVMPGITTEYPFPATAAAVRIKAGGDVADTAAGTGARTVTVYGLDATYKPVQETITTAGASASALTTQTFLRVNRVEVTTAGSSLNNVDDIIIETAAGVVLGFVLSGQGSGAPIVFSTAENQGAFIRGWQLTYVDTDTLFMFFAMRTYDASVKAPAPFQIFDSYVRIGSIATSLPGAIYLPPKTDVMTVVFNSGLGPSMLTMGMDVQYCKVK